MGKKTESIDYRVIVEPRARGDFGFASIGGLEWTPEQEKRICEDIIEGIKKAARADIIEDAGRVTLDYEKTEVCEYCGSPWTEGNSPHNGGCCEDDEAIMKQSQEAT